MTNLEEFVKKAGQARHIISNMSTEMKNKILFEISNELIRNSKDIIKANKIDYNNAEEKGIKGSLLDRLLLNDVRIKKMAKAVEEIAELPDPVGEIVWGSNRPNGLRLRKIRVPIGVILIIYESRPNVTTDAAALSFKSGNVTILRGGSDSFNSNKAIVKSINSALTKFNLPEEIISFVPEKGHNALKDIVKFDKYIDLVIPRGGKRLIDMITAESRIPVVYHADGICHLFIDESAQKDMAIEIAVNAKVQRPGVCNAIETLLIHKDFKYTEEMIKSLMNEGVTIIGDESVQEIFSNIQAATESDWATEYLDLRLSVKVVDNINEAIEHIEKYGSHHSDSIVTENYTNSEKFLHEIDSSTVYVNASTRFTDGGEFGFGAEIGISTQKLHARGPMGLQDLTTTKFIVYGDGQIRK